MNNPHLSTTNFAPSLVMSHAKTEARALLRKVGAVKLKEEGMAPASFSFEFDLDGLDTAVRNAVRKLVVILMRNLVKLIPFYEYVFSLEDTRDSIAVCVANSGRNLEVVTRYVSLLNYKCRLYGVPAYLCIVDAPTTNAKIRKDTRGIMGDEYALEVAPNKQVEITWSALFRKTGLDDNIDVTRYNFGEDVKDSNKWNVISLYRLRSIAEGSHSTLDVNEVERRRLLSPERIFFFLPQAIKVLTTLSRKAAYDYRAFSVSPE